jgi:type II secretory pathway pseudopilin PulG
MRKRWKAVAANIVRAMFAVVFPKKMNKKAFTLLELVIYMALVVIFVSGALFFGWNVIYGREKAYQQKLVEQNARLIMARIAYEIRRAEEVNSLTSSSLELENGVNDTTINFSSNAIQITADGNGPYDLNSNAIYVDNLTFTELNSEDENSRNVNVSLNLRQGQTQISPHFQAETTLNQSIELNSQFNQGRGLLMDASLAELSEGNTKLINTTLENSGETDITIDKMTVSWTGGDEESVLEEISIDSSVVWSGSADSGDLLDITDVVLLAEAAAIPLDWFVFSETMAEAVISVSYTMSDGSTARVEMDFTS